MSATPRTVPLSPPYPPSAAPPHLRQAAQACCGMQSSRCEGFRLQAGPPPLLVHVTRNNSCRFRAGDLQTVAQHRAGRTIAGCMNALMNAFAHASWPPPLPSVHSLLTLSLLGARARWSARPATVR